MESIQIRASSLCVCGLQFVPFKSLVICAHEAILPIHVELVFVFCLKAIVNFDLMAITFGPLSPL